MCHHVTLHESYVVFEFAGRSAALLRIVINVDGNHFLALPCKLTREQTLAASHIQCAFALR